MSASIDVLVVDSCLRDGSGGSPTAVVANDRGLSDADLTRVPRLAGTSHVAVVDRPTAPNGTRAIRFFTSAGELPGCGHGAVAVIAALTCQTGQPAWDGLMHAGGRDFAARGVLDSGREVVEAWFDQGHVDCRAADPRTVESFLTALRLSTTDLDPDDEPVVASPGRPRLLIPVSDRRVVDALEPDYARLADESRRHGQLGCFVHAPATPSRRPTARMFAPVIGVEEDVANANSTGCLAAYRLTRGDTSILAVDQGDALGRPSTVFATATRTATGIVTGVGGTARLVETIRVNLR